MTEQTDFFVVDSCGDFWDGEEEFGRFSNAHNYSSLEGAWLAGKNALVFCDDDYLTIEDGEENEIVVIFRNNFPEA